MKKGNDDIEILEIDDVNESGKKFVKVRKKRKKLKVLSIIVNLFVFILIGLLSGFIGYKMQDNEPSHFSVSYDTINTRKTYNSSLVMVGDALIHDAVYKQFKKGNGYNFDGMFKYVGPVVQKYSLAYYNQETILGGKSLGLSNYPQFNSPQEVGDGFVKAGFNLVSMATNHTLDKYYSTNGKTVINSRNYWNNQMEKNQYLIAAGSYNSKEERDALVIREKDGITYAMLSYTTTTNGINIPKGKDYVVNFYDKEKVKKDIENYRDKVDLLMVAMHWGEEYIHYPNTEQKTIAKYLASLGVNIIIGCHSHAIQPITFIDDTLVVYSLGNFVSSQTYTDQLIGLMAMIDIKKDVYHGKTTITLENPQADLLYTNKNTTYGRFVIYPFNKLNNNILYNYKKYYTDYSKYVTAYNKNVKMVGV